MSRLPGRRLVRAHVTLLFCLSTALTCTAANAQPAAGAAARRSFWLLVLGADQGYDTNPTMITGGSSDVTTTAGGSLAAFKRRQMSTYTISANAGLNRFQRNSQLSNFAYGVNVSADKRITAAVTIAGQVGFDRRLSPNALSAVNLPVLAALQQKQLTANASITDRLTARTSVTGRLGYSQVWFDASSAIPGFQANGSAQMSHVFSPTNNVTVDFNALQGSTQGSTTSIQTLGASWRKLFGQLAVTGGGGVARASALGVVTYSPTGAVSAADSIGPGYLSGGYSYTVTPAFGLSGVFATSAIFVNYDLVAVRGNLVSFSGVTGWSSQTGSTSPALRAESVSLRMRRVTRTGITLSLGSSYRARRDLFLTKGFGVNLGLGFALGS